MERLAQSETYYPAYQEGHSGVTGVAFGVCDLTDGDWLDFNDSTFKAVGWTTQYQAMAEDENGLWNYTTGWAIPDANCTYQIQFKVTDGTGTYYAGGPKIVVNSSLLDVLADWVNGGRLDLILDAILAMLDDARGEPGQGNPPVNPDAMTKLDYLYKAWRNKKDNDGTTRNLYADDAATVDQKSSVSEAAGTVTTGEWATGP